MLSDSTYFVDLFKDFPKLRLQKEMLNLANIEAHKKFVNFVEHIDTSEAILIESGTARSVITFYDVYRESHTTRCSRHKT